MTLNSEGLLPCPFCGGENAYVQNAGWKANTFIRCPDCPSSFATCDGPRPHEDSVVSWNRRALPPVDGLEVVAHAYVVEGECEQIEWGSDVLLPDDPSLVELTTLSQASSVIAGLKAEVADLRDEWQAEYDARLAANTTRRAAEARITSLEEENKRLIALIEEKGSASLIRAAKEVKG